MKRYSTLAVLMAMATACTEQATAPGACPDFCPGGSIDIRDTILTDVIQRDSVFLGYMQPYQAEFMAVADSPGVIDSRAIFRMTTTPTTVAATTTDTVPITVDSARLRVVIARRDSDATNLYLKIYRLPISIDTASTFAQLAPDFAGPAVDSVNVSALLNRPAIVDTTTRAAFGGDTIRTDSAGHVLRVGGDSSLFVFFDLDATQAPFVAADSGKIAWGVRVAADSFASVSLGVNNPNNDLLGDKDAFLTWFYHYTIPDTVSTQPDSVVNTSIVRGTIFHSFVFNPPNPPVDDNLAVGGAPSARSLVRVAFPPSLRDSVDVVRATLILVPTAPVQGFRSDSFAVLARAVLTDLGAKSPLSTSALFGRATVHIGTADTIRIEITDIFRSWVTDTSIATSLALSWMPNAAATARAIAGRGVEASSFTQVRFFSSRASLRPALHVTYVKRFPFGTP